MWKGSAVYTMAEDYNERCVPSGLLIETESYLDDLHNIDDDPEYSILHHVNNCVNKNSDETNVFQICVTNNTLSGCLNKQGR